MEDKADEPTQNQTDRREALLREYSEVGYNFRALTDIRFRLLQLLPLATLAAAALKPPEENTPGTLLFAAFGLAATLSLVTYNKRNDQLYDQLVARAAEVERELGVPDGGFAHRPAEWLAYGLWPFRWRVGHRHAISAVYLATASFWLFLVLEAAAPFAVDTKLGEWLFSFANRFAGSNEDQQRAVVLGVLAAVAVIFIALAGRLMKWQENCRLRSMKKAVRGAFGLIVKHERQMIHSGMNDPSDEQVDAAWRSKATTSGEFLANLHSQDFAALCAKATLLNRDKILRRIEVYSKLDNEGMRRYVTPQAGDMRDAQILALLTDLPPNWIHDVCTGRRD